MNTLQKLRARLEELEERARKLLRAAREDGGRAFTEQEQSDYDDALGEIATVKRQIANEERARDLGLDGQRSAASADDGDDGDDGLTPEQRAQLAAARGRGGGEAAFGSDGGTQATVRLDEAEKGFRHFHEYLEAVYNASLDSTAPEQVDKRLFALNANGGHFGEAVLERRAALETRVPTGQSTLVPADGGFLVQKDFNDSILKKTHDDSLILSRVTQQPISGRSNGFKQMMLNEDSRVDGSRHGGLLAYWRGESDAYTASTQETWPFEVNVHSLTGLVYLTDESMDDAPAVAASIQRDMPSELRWKAESAIWEGNGAGMPLGIQGHAAQVEVAAEGGQAADTVVWNNVINVWARMWNLTGAAFVINYDVWPEIMNLVDTGNNAIYLPGGNVAGAPFGTLYGRPVIPWEHAETLGDAGDFNFIDFSQYMFVTKGGVRGDSSIHVRFLNGEQVLRFTWRAGGAPMWRAPLTPAKGTNTRSPFIRLAARA